MISAGYFPFRDNYKLGSECCVSTYISIVAHVDESYCKVHITFMEVNYSFLSYGKPFYKYVITSAPLSLCCILSKACLSDYPRPAYVLPDQGVL